MANTQEEMQKRLDSMQKQAQQILLLPLAPLIQLTRQMQQKK